MLAEGVPVARLDQPEPDDELMAQIPLTVRLQLLTLRRAEAGGHDPDTVIKGAWDGEKLWATGAPLERSSRWGHTWAGKSGKIGRWERVKDVDEGVR